MFVLLEKLFRAGGALLRTVVAFLVLFVSGGAVSIVRQAVSYMLKR
jgi:hypothetical protein